MKEKTTIIGIIFIFLIISTFSINTLSSENIYEDNNESNEVIETSGEKSYSDFFIGLHNLYVKQSGKYGKIAFDYDIWIQQTFYDDGTSDLKIERGKSYSGYASMKVRFPSLSFIESRCKLDLDHHISLTFLFGHYDF